jgi:hypothetical protein
MEATRQQSSSFFDASVPSLCELADLDVLTRLG